MTCVSRAWCQTDLGHCLTNGSYRLPPWGVFFLSLLTPDHWVGCVFFFYATFKDLFSSVVFGTGAVERTNKRNKRLQQSPRQGERNKQRWTGGGRGGDSQYQHFSIIKQFRFNGSISLRTLCLFFFLPPFKPPHQTSRNLFNTKEWLKEEIQFPPPRSCTHPGEQVVSYLINYRRLVSLPDCRHLFQYRRWKYSTQSGDVSVGIY